MIDPKGLNPVSKEVKLLRPVLDFNHANLKGQLLGNGPKSSHHANQAPGADQSHRIGAIGVTHGEQKARKAGNVIGMIVGKADDIDRIRGNPSLLHGDLCSLSAVNEQAVPVESCDQRCQPAPGQGHGSSRPQETDV